MTRPCASDACSRLQETFRIRPCHGVSCGLWVLSLVGCHGEELIFYAFVPTERANETRGLAWGQEYDKGEGMVGG